METPPPAVDLTRQDSEVEAELRLALEEACLEAGVTLSSNIHTKALFKNIESEKTSVQRVAKWFITTRSIRSQFITSQPAKLADVYGQSSSNSSASPVAPLLSLHERLQRAAVININSQDFSWKNLVSVHGTEHADLDVPEEKGMLGPAEVTVNSGGVVYFALFRTENGEEAAACIKFTPSRLTTQSERLGYEIARHLGVLTPQARIIHTDTTEWTNITQATENAKQTAQTGGDIDLEKTCDEIIEALHINRCLLLMGYVAGCPLLDCEQAFETQEASEKTCAALGRVLLLDLILRNEDRLVCQELGWRGNRENLLCSKILPILEPLPKKKKTEFSLKKLPRQARSGLTTADLQQRRNERQDSDGEALYLIAIDSGVPRRPPAGKRENDKAAFPRFVEMLLNDVDTAAKVVMEISGEQLKQHCKNMGQLRAFRSGFREGLERMYFIRLFLLKLFRKLDHLLKNFVTEITESLPTDWSPEKSSPVSNPCSPTTSRVSPHLERRMTLKLKDFSKLARSDDGIHEILESWDERLRVEGRKLCEAQGFMTGFLESGGSHSLVDSYELKIRLEHVIERMDLISQGRDTEKPSRVTESLYVGGVLSAKSMHTLRHVGITHVLCLCPIEIGCTEASEEYNYKCLQVLDIEEEDIGRYFEESCKYIEEGEKSGGKVLVHCFEGKSRSPTIILAYLIITKGKTLLEAWSMLKAVHFRSQPNDGFMRALVDVERRVHGNTSMDWQQRRPLVQICPVCEKNVGVSKHSLAHHIQRFHSSYSSSSSSLL